MHAVVVQVTINDFEPAAEMLRSEIVPRVSGAPGFVAGYWARSDSSGLSFIVFESEDAARVAADMIQSQPARDEVTLDNVEIREVVANA
jgi:chemotaxis protein CheY-P-specific phosphatase CheC